VIATLAVGTLSDHYHRPHKAKVVYLTSAAIFFERYRKFSRAMFRSMGT
jgi:hypothetical protein